jgi:hypothetical protein
MNPLDSQKLEAATHALLRGLPNRKAPSGLEARVLAELARRAALPWWRKSFAHWPSAARMLFLAGSALAGLAAVYLLVTVMATRGGHQVEGSISNSLAWLLMARDVVAAFDGTARRLLAAVPPLWLYGVAGGIAACYAALAAIGAATYRAVTFARQSS